jgi:hypothetical protein
MKATRAFDLISLYLLIFPVLLSACASGAGAEVTLQPSGRRLFQGVIKTGADLGEVKSFCSEGYYLVAEEGYLTGQTTTLLLGTLDSAGEPVMLSDADYLGKTVEVDGLYPAQEVFCDALICQCEDYILVKAIRSVE